MNTRIRNKITAKLTQNLQLKTWSWI